jgi:hypothetical protein
LKKQILINQYNKCFEMLTEMIKKYDEKIWNDDKNYQYPVWQIVYHLLYITNIYCSSTEKGIIKWPKQKVNYQFFGKTPWPPFEEVIADEPYSKSDMIEFSEFVNSKIPVYLDDMKPEERCWPHWYDEVQLEFQLNNIRHIQHHIGQIIERQDIASNFKYDWK